MKVVVSEYTVVTAEKMISPRRHLNRNGEVVAGDAVWRLCERWGEGFYWETVPKLVACPNCRRPILIMTHAFAPSPNWFAFSSNLAKIASKINVPYVLVTFTQNPPRIGYRVVGQNGFGGIVSVDGFFRFVYPRLLGNNCPECGRRFEHTPRNSFANLKVEILSGFYEHDSLTFEIVHRELLPEWHSSIDIDAIVFNPDGETFAVIEVTTYTNGDIFRYKTVTISREFARRLSVPLFVLYIPFSGDGDWGVISDASRRRFRGNLYEVAEFISNEAKHYATKRTKPNTTNQRYNQLHSG
ncbi:MAG: hypothetical protein QXH20_02955 [Candidatus Bathyarchaeia archaeon]